MAEKKDPRDFRLAIKHESPAEGDGIAFIAKVRVDRKTFGKAKKADARKYILTQFKYALESMMPAVEEEWTRLGLGPKENAKPCEPNTTKQA